MDQDNQCSLLLLLKPDYFLVTCRVFLWFIVCSQRMTVFRQRERTLVDICQSGMQIHCLKVCCIACFVVVVVHCVRFER